MSEIQLCNDCFEKELSRYEGFFSSEERHTVKSFETVQGILYSRCEEIRCDECCQELYLGKFTRFEKGENNED